MKSQEHRTERFDVVALHAAMDSERRFRRLTWKDVAAQSGVSASTLTRLSQGSSARRQQPRSPHRWLGMSADHFMRAETVDQFGAASPLAQISSILQSRPPPKTAGSGVAKAFGIRQCLIRCLRCLLLVMCTHPFAKKALTLYLARSEGHELYFGCNLMHRKVLASSHQHLMAEAPAPEPRRVESPAMGQVSAIPKVGGLHHYYTRRAA